MGKRTVRAISTDTINEIRRRRASETAAVVAAAMGLSKTTVQRYSPTTKSAAADPEVVRRLRAGERQRDVAAATGRTEPYVSQVARLLSVGVDRSQPSEAERPPSIVRPPESDDDRVAASIIADGIRTRILKQLAAGGFVDSNRLLDALRRDGGASNIAVHEVQHCLRQLNEQGAVRFGLRRTGSGNGHRILTDITLTASGRRGLEPVTAGSGPVVEVAPPVHVTASDAPSYVEERDGLAERQRAAKAAIAAAVAVPGPLVATAEELAAPVIHDPYGPVPIPARVTVVDELRLDRVAVHADGSVGVGATVIRSHEEAPPMEIEQEDYPLLHGLVARRSRAERRATLLEQAAALTDDAGEREDLELKALLAREVTFTDLEAEYLRFAKES